MNFQEAVAQYLSPFCQAQPAQAEVCFDADGGAQGRFFNARLGSRFQAISCLYSGRVLGHEAQVRHIETGAPGLNIWKLLDHAASDQESIVLDRLCRLLHTLNFHRLAGPIAGQLYLNVHARLLAGVSANHGAAFHQVLAALELSHEKIVLQLPSVTSNQRWELNFVADNYRRNGFRIALKAADALQARRLLEQLSPDVIKVNPAALVDETVAQRLLSDAEARKVCVIFTQAQALETRAMLQRVAHLAAGPVYVQASSWTVMSAAQPPVPARKAMLVPQ